MKRALTCLLLLAAGYLLLDRQRLFGPLFAQTGATQQDRELAALIRQVTNRSSDGLTPEKHPNGSVSLDLKGRFQNVPLSKLNPDGTPAVGCVDTIEGANAFFGRNLDTGQPLPASPAPANETVKQVAQHRMSASEYRFYLNLIEDAARRRKLAPNAATLTIQNNDGAGEGFNDPAARAPEGGNPGTTLGAQRINVFNQAAGIWGAFLDSNVATTIRSNFDSIMPCGGGSGVLGFAGPNNVHANFTNAPFTGTFYPAALANKLRGLDLEMVPGTPEIDATFNSDIDNGCLFPGTRFYYGLDNATPALTINLLVVVLHEMGHGLGFVSFVNETTGAFLGGLPDIYSRFMFDRDVNLFWHQMTNAQRATSAVNTNDVLWDGASVRIGSGFLTAGRDVATGRVQLYTPNPLELGSSVSHWSTAAAPNLLMEPSINIGLPIDLDLTRQQMRDIGWYRDSDAILGADTITNVLPNSGTLTVGNMANVTWTNNGGFNRNVTIELSTDGGTTFPVTIATNIANTSPHAFTVPNNPTTQGRVRVREHNFAAPLGLSSANFTIAAGACTMPSIMTQPTGQTVCAPAPASFSVTASGTAPLSYQWRKGGNNIGGATNSTFTINPTMASDAGNYDVVVTNACGTATSNTVTLTVNTAPAVTTQPSNQTVCAGGNASFTVAASGTPTPTVQWQESTDGGANFNNLAGQTNTTLTLNGVTAGMNNRRYRAVFTNTCNTATTNAAILTVNTAPSVTTHPTDQTVCAGGNASFTVAASGTPTPTVQWQESTDGGANFNNLAGQTNTTLTLNGVTAGMNNRRYRAVFTNSCNAAVNSNAALLTVNTAPAVTTQPIDQTVCPNANAVFTAAASGTPTPTVQWQESTDGVNFSNLAGQTNTTLTLNGVTVAMNNRRYRAAFTNSCSTVNSNAAILTVSTSPNITQHPQSQTVCAGASASFSVAANGTGPFTFQWRKNSVNIPGQTNSTFTINPTATSDAAGYDVIVTGACGSATSNTVTLTVNTAPAVTTQPSNQTVCAGGNASFTVAASGTPTPTVQWQESTDGGANFNNLAGQTNTTLTLNGVTAGMNNRRYRAVFTNTCNTAMTNAAILTVNTAPSVTTHPTDQTVCAGGNASFTVAASGTPTPTVQWQESTDGGANFSNLAGQTNITLTLTNVSAGMNNRRYRAAFTNSCGTTNSNVAILSVSTSPNITTQPQSQTVCASASASFSVAANGTGPLTFQWRKNGNDIGGATNSTFTLNSTVANDASDYDVIVTGACGSATSNLAHLTVNTAAGISQQPTGQTVCAGMPASFAVTASGTTPFTFQWRKSGINISGQTNSSFNINSTATTDAGNYDVVVTNSCGTATSNAVTLTVNTAPNVTQQPTDQTVCAGGNAVFTVVASGTPSPTVQWQESTDGVNFSNLAGQTSLTLTLNSVNAGMNNRRYRAVFTNSCNTATSNAARLTVNVVPGITTQPTNQAVCPNGTAVFTAAATAIPAATVQWEQSTDGGANFSPLAGETNTTLTLPNVNAALHNNRYRAVFTNSCGSVNSAAATLTVHSFSIAPLTQNFLAVGGNGNITVGGVCTWTATSNAPWLTNVTPMGSGNGTVNYTVAPNSGAQRTGTITAASLTHTVTQDANGGLVFHPLPRPLRLLDTRPDQSLCDNIGVPITGGTALTTQARITCNSLTIPANAQAIVGNVTVINQTASFGFLTLFPAGQTLPLAANIIYEPGQLLSNNFSVRLNANGEFNIFAERTLHTVIDVSGYFAPPQAAPAPAEAEPALRILQTTGLYYHALPRPLRLLDTRADQSLCDNIDVPINGGTALSTQARITCNGLTIPPAAQAIVGNATVINQTASFGFMTLFPAGQTLPLAANMIYAPNQLLSNYFTVGLSAGGAFDTFAERTLHAVIDIAGYYSLELNDINGPGLLFNPLPQPLRLLDTRADQSLCDNIGLPIAAGGTLSTQARVTCNNITIPTTAQAISGNITVLNQTASFGFMTLFPAGQQLPLAANMIYAPGQLLSNAFVVGLSGGGAFNTFGERTIHVVVDVSGYFAP